MFPRDYFHLGMVVKDFDAAVARLGAQMGLSWSPEIRTVIQMWTRDQGVRQFQVRAVYSVEAPHVEIIRETPGSVMRHVEGRPLHHLGYWTNDLHGESAALEKAGYPRVMYAVHETGQMYGVVYHEMPGGLLLELVGRDQFADWNGFLTGRIQFGATP
jgi:Glyoxalase/Bleomycin resistance protein/Dioxygenase superfamily